MNRQFRALQYSLAIHLCLLGGLLLASRYTTPPLTISLIDFSLAESSGPVAEEPSRSVPKVRPAPPPVKKVAARPVEKRAEKIVDPKAPPPVNSVPEPQSVPVQAEPRPPSHEADRDSPQVSAEELSAPKDPDAPGEVAAAGAGGLESRPFESRDKYLREHYTYIRELIMKNLLYPAIARERGWTGQTRVAFVVCENGCVADIRVVTSSGYRMLDKNVIETIKRASPFPAPPVRAEIVLPITYELN